MVAPAVDVTSAFVKLAITVAAAVLTKEKVVLATVCVEACCGLRGNASPNTLC